MTHVENKKEKGRCKYNQINHNIKNEWIIIQQSKGIKYKYMLQHDKP